MSIDNSKIMCVCVQGGFSQPVRDGLDYVYTPEKTPGEHDDLAEEKGELKDAKLLLEILEDP